jgi:hypothetical protein
MGNISGKFLDPVKRVPEGASGRDGGQVGAVSLSLVLSGRAVKGGVFECFFIFFARGAQGRLIFVEVGGLGGEVALS